MKEPPQIGETFEYYEQFLPLPHWHNDLSLDNVLLHFPPNFLDKVYISICNWAMARNFNDLKESLYIHESQEAKIRIMQCKWWVASELNYVLPPPGSTRDIDFERRSKSTPNKKHLQWAKLPSGSTWQLLSQVLQ